MTNAIFGSLDPNSRPVWMRRRALAGRVSIGLVFLVSLPWGIVTGFSGLALAVRLLGLAAFLAAYYAAYLIRISFSGRLLRSEWAALAALTVLSLGLPPLFGGDWLGLPIYLSIAYSMRLPFRLALPGVVAASVAYGPICLAVGVDGGTTLTLMGTAFGLGLMMLGFRHSRMLVLELQKARCEVGRLAATEERLRIARDLHDVLGHSLSLIVLKSELARRDPGRAPAEVSDIESVARQALADIREVVSGYRQGGLTVELDNARAALTAAGVVPVVVAPGEPFPDVVDGLFGWAVREGVTNVVRHARATRCTVTLSRTRREDRLEIVDDGAGGGSVPGNGLTGLAERIEAAGGQVTAGPLPGGGFRLAVRVPVPAAVVSRA